jgi:hypothetical protein
MITECFGHPGRRYVTEERLAIWFSSQRGTGVAVAVGV